MEILRKRIELSLNQTVRINDLAEGGNDEVTIAKILNEVEYVA